MIAQSYSIPEGTSFSANSGGQGNSDITVIVSFDGQPGFGGRPPTIGQGSNGIEGQLGSEKQQGGQRQKETGQQGTGEVPSIDEQQDFERQRPSMGANGPDGQCPCTCSCPSDAFSQPQGPISSGGIGEASTSESILASSSGAETTTAIVPISPINSGLDIPPAITSPILATPTEPSIPLPDPPGVSETLELESPAPVNSAGPNLAAPMETLSPSMSPSTLSTAPTSTDETSIETSTPTLPVSEGEIDIASLQLQSTLVFSLGG
ncbi:predicted protein [Uncinocarpus reesii 1704]|uniref:Uncharacterized protein n=1 Tax=Uncinocarpus reesii (strain UAMH 1704) TaxID=336963 RepID=C4JIJ8_UNCRE|nr:uncharacterized protein UREG_01535 [Uncinocarpus reesii 1704]EEP76686.1 predicted protein [Uncinocarpus reesii 1704]